MVKQYINVGNVTGAAHIFRKAGGVDAVTAYFRKDGIFRHWDYLSSYKC